MGYITLPSLDLSHRPLPHHTCLSLKFGPVTLNKIEKCSFQLFWHVVIVIVWKKEKNTRIHFLCPCVVFYNQTGSFGIWLLMSFIRTSTRCHALLCEYGSLVGPVIPPLEVSDLQQGGNVEICPVTQVVRLSVFTPQHVTDSGWPGSHWNEQDHLTSFWDKFLKEHLCRTQQTRLHH